MNRPELRAHDHAMRLPVETVVQELRDLLTPRLVAYIAGVGDVVVVHRWADGIRTARAGEVEDRPRFALAVARMLSDQDGPRVVQAWFMGLNLHLDDRSPARVLRDGCLDEVGRAVLAAARGFLVEG
jgi:hypothetical protein